MLQSPEQNSIVGEPLTGFEKIADREKIFSSLTRTGFKGNINEELINRLILFERESTFNEDARLIERGMDNVLYFLEKHSKDKQSRLVLTEEQKINGRLAALLHDIGKSGPAHANREEQEAVIKLYAIESINTPSCSVGDIVAERFDKQQAEELLGKLAACLVFPEMTMRQFWNLHAKWTYELLLKYPEGLNNHIQIIAGSHHLDNGISPHILLKTNAPLKSDIIETLGGEVNDLEERILMVVDKYQAVVRRGGVDHEAAIAWVRNNLVKYGKDDSLQSVIDAVDELGKQDKIFV